MRDTIEIKGARGNNLKNIDLTIPKNQLVIFTGLSGSGKSTLAFDTIYAEGQRRYIESLSSYARQFLDKLDKPDVDKIEGLTPAIAIEQKSTSKNPRSTVGTVTEIYDYLRVLYARIGEQYCHLCGKKITQMSVTDIIDEVLKLPNGAKMMLLAPLIKDKKGSFAELIASLRQKGFIRAMIDGVVVRLDEEIELSKTKKHTIKVIVDRVVLKSEDTQRIAEAIEKALKLSFGELEVHVLNAEETGCASEIHYSEHFACFDCKVSFDALEPLSFSFNSPKGACTTCDGLGHRYAIDLNKIINEEKSIEEGAIRIIYGFNKGYYFRFLKAFCQTLNIPIDVPFESLQSFEQKMILYGAPDSISFVWKKHTITKVWSGVVKVAYDMFKDEKELGDYMSEKVCDACGGNRLKPQSLAVKVAGHSISDAINVPIKESFAFFSEEQNFAYLTSAQHKIAEPILKEITERLFFLNDVGLEYLTLSRDARTISGGESQRIRIASQIGSGLTGVIYVLDEPSIGLHERDTNRLINTLRSLQKKGNSVIVVEHDKETILTSDYIVDIGPLAGKNGGEVVFSGTLEELKRSDTLTAKYLSGTKAIEYPHNRAQKAWIRVENVNVNNIQNLSVDIPLSNLVSVTGVSGSGKSSLILQTLLPVAKELLNRARNITKVEGVSISGLERLDKVIYLDQSPIGRTPRSNPATYTSAMDDIRELFVSLSESKIRGYKAGRFSFNVKGGRCEKCKGEGEIKIEMHFLPDVMVTCDACAGRRYNAQTLQIEYKGKNIADVLAMSVEEAYSFFKAIPKLNAKLQRLKDVGLGYITLGQNAITLSGGEAQRVKLAKELSKKDTGKTLYILDEPTTGLHFADVDKLLSVLHHLVELKNSVVVIEHNLDIIKNSDYIIDIGPEGGAGGGNVVDCGTPKEIASRYKTSGSYTGEYLSKEFTR